ncbi:uncharacterized protein METZ01_LOCUS361194, partial [marine metagenome]
MKYLFLFFASFFMAFFGVWLIRRLAIQNHWHSAPSSDRWHQTTTANIGGVGFVPVIIIFQIYIIFNQSLYLPLLGIVLVLGTLSMFILGLIDDIWPVKPLTKLLSQIAVSSLFIHAGGVFNLFAYDLINMLITYLWFLVIINSLNMLDNMDGLAVGIASLSIIYLVLISIPPSGTEPLIILLGITILAALIAFWLFNFNPASIFMGDSGSLSIGFILAALTIPSELNYNFGLIVNTKIENYIFLLIPLALLSVQIFDFTFVTINRLLQGKKPYIGGKDHTSHSLVKLGMSNKKEV